MVKRERSKEFLEKFIETVKIDRMHSQSVIETMNKIENYPENGDESKEGYFILTNDNIVIEYEYIKNDNMVIYRDLNIRQDYW